jgi:outer membrane receptor protein involved in Fe transport
MKNKPLYWIIITLIMAGVMNAGAQSLDDTIAVDEVVVTGTRTEVNRKNMPINVSVISHDELNELNESVALNSISSRIPGVFVTERGVIGYSLGPNSAGQISIRGISGSPNSEVLVLIDGSPQYMGLFGHPFPNSYVSSDLEKVEVIKGPASILYGSNAMGGVINFITRKPSKDGVSGEAEIGYGSFNTLKGMGNIGIKKNGFTMFLSFNHDQTDGHRDSSDFKISNGFIKAGYTLNKNISVSADYSIAQLHSVDPGVEMAPSSFTADVTRGKGSLSVHNTYKMAEGGLTGFVNYGHHELSDGWISNDANYGLSLFEGLKLFSGSLITVGADYKNFGGKGNNIPNEYKDTWVSITEMAAYVFARQNIEKLSLSAGLRIENNSNYGNELVPQFGMAYNAGKSTSLKASVSKGFRSPLILETYLFLPNPDLKPESLMNYEIGWSQSFLKKKVSSEISLFWLEGKNAIEVIPNDAPPPPFKRANTGTFTHKGFEIETRIQIMKNLNSEITYSYLNMKTPRLGAPGNQLFAGLNYRIKKFGIFVQANYIEGLYSQVGATNSIENYFLLNGSLKYHPLDWLEIYVSAKNLTNTEYRINYGYSMPGINFISGLHLRF